jgi:S-DNA-T family DNA segregation ATPase FtsK/SpoIIIE
VIPDVAPEHLTLPVLDPVPPRAPFPFVATAAPVLVSIGIWAVTGSVYSLLFAALGPVVAVGSLLDGRRQRRRTGRRDAERAVAALRRARDRVLEVHERERARLGRIAPPLHELCTPGHVAARWAQGDLESDQVDAPIPVRLGRAERPAAVIVEGGAGALEYVDDLPSAVRSALGDVRRAAAVLDDAPWLADAGDGIGVVGPLPAARALVRSIVLQLAASCSPQTTRITATIRAASDERWVAALPHEHAVTVAESGHSMFRLIGQRQQSRVACASERSKLPPGLGQVIDLGVRVSEGAPSPANFEAVGIARAVDLATTLAELAAERGMVAADRRLPDAVALAEVLSGDGHETRSTPGGRGLRAPIGRDSTGVVELDLVRDGPHAVVAGTTGSGKSELLVSWVLAMAARHPPSAVTFLLVDFKGGAAFAPLVGLPHVIGSVSDLDPRRSARAIESLRAELLRRERVLAECGVRSIDELEQQADEQIGTGLSRLVIVVDEFAAVVSGQPGLHELFADLSGRGRSLGLHLVLCTQRPSGVVRDAVLANVALRISLRVTDRGDSIAMLGTDAAAGLPSSPRGRALIADGSGAIREVQLALSEPGDAERLRAAVPPPLDIVWCDPLPELLPLDELLLDAIAEAAPGIPFGRVDLPGEQRQPIARHDPRRDGHLLVLGAARSGRTTVLRTMAAGATSAGVGCTVVPDDPAEAWSLLAELIERPDDRIEVVLLDDLDLLLGRMDPDARLDLVELLTRIVRGARSRSLVVSAQHLSGGLQALAGLFDARLLLRQPSRDEHVLSGGDGAAFDPRLPAGAGRWTGSRGGGAAVQVAIGAAPLPAAELVELAVLRPTAGRPLAIVCPRPAALARRWTESGARVVVLGDDPVPDDGELRVSAGAAPVVLLGDPDAWQAEWALLGLVRRELPLAVIGCTASELRAITRAREPAPPLGGRPGECWWVEAGGVRRAVLDEPAPARNEPSAPRDAE